LFHQWIDQGSEIRAEWIFAAILDINRKTGNQKVAKRSRERSFSSLLCGCVGYVTKQPLSYIDGFRSVHDPYFDQYLSQPDSFKANREP
jgi:hypothetical protein